MLQLYIQKKNTKFQLLKRKKIDSDADMIINTDFKNIFVIK